MDYSSSIVFHHLNVFDLSIPDLCIKRETRRVTLNHFTTNLSKISAQMFSIKTKQQRQKVTKEWNNRKHTI